jgi:PadR family transcriptional regulator AphA
MAAPPATYGLLGMLATRSWTGYELTRQVRRSLRFVWPTSEAHLYREQRRLVELGWASVEDEPAGRRTRKRYAITPAGRRALADWLATDPDEPHFQVEGILRTFYADSGSTQDLLASMRSTAESARSMLAEMLVFVDEYLEDGGPLTMLEQGVTGEFHGRPMFPERLHSVALAIDATTRMLGELDRFCTEAADEVAGWPSPADPSLTASTRARLEAIRDRAEAAGT